MVTLAAILVTRVAFMKAIAAPKPPSVNRAPDSAGRGTFLDIDVDHGRKRRSGSFARLDLRIAEEPSAADGSPSRCGTDAARVADVDAFEHAVSEFRVRYGRARAVPASDKDSETLAGSPDVGYTRFRFPPSANRSTGEWPVRQGSTSSDEGGDAGDAGLTLKVSEERVARSSLSSSVRESTWPTVESLGI